MYASRLGSSHIFSLTNANAFISAALGSFLISCSRDAMISGIIALAKSDAFLPSEPMYCIRIITRRNHGRLE
jgi:hypothetical protein